jgi:hypothetical protein
MLNKKTKARIRKNRVRQVMYKTRAERLAYAETIRRWREGGCQTQPVGIFKAHSRQ